MKTIKCPECFGSKNEARMRPVEFGKKLEYRHVLGAMDWSNPRTAPQRVTRQVETKWPILSSVLLDCS
jgi:hypothetical protein